LALDNQSPWAIEWHYFVILFNHFVTVLACDRQTDTQYIHILC